MWNSLYPSPARTEMQSLWGSCPGLPYLKDCYVYGGTPPEGPGSATGWYSRSLAWVWQNILPSEGMSCKENFLFYFISRRVLGFGKPNLCNGLQEYAKKCTLNYSIHERISVNASNNMSSIKMCRLHCSLRILETMLIRHWIHRCLYNCIINSLWPANAIWRHIYIYGSKLAQVMACCLLTQSHCHNQCWLIINRVLWHSSGGIIMRRSEDTNQ